MYNLAPESYSNSRSDVVVSIRRGRPHSCLEVQVAGCSVIILSHCLLSRLCDKYNFVSLSIGQYISFYSQLNFLIVILPLDTIVIHMMTDPSIAFTSINISHSSIRAVIINLA